MESATWLDQVKILSGDSSTTHGFSSDRYVQLIGDAVKEQDTAMQRALYS